jgi:hypothetical protein
MTSLDGILADKYPAKAHARRVAEGLKALGHSGGAIYLEAQKTRLIEDNDEPVPFRYALLVCEDPVARSSPSCIYASLPDLPTIADSVALSSIFPDACFQTRPWSTILILTS